MRCGLALPQYGRFADPRLAARDEPELVDLSASLAEGFGL